MDTSVDFAISAKLVAFLSMLISVLTVQAGGIVYLFFGIALVYLLVQKKFRYAIGFSIFYLIVCIIWYLMTHYQFEMIVLSSFHLYFFWLMTPVFMVSNDLILSPPGQVSAFLSKHKAHTHVILAVLVIFRFFPTIKAELQSIWQSMHNRGLLNPKQILCHPLDSFEYILVPLLMRMVQISDQLTISALSRGIEAPVKRSAYYDKQTGLKDYCCIGFFIILTLIILAKEVLF